MSAVEPESVFNSDCGLKARNITGTWGREEDQIDKMSAITVKAL
jgi:hypothetical protein